ncbi:DUF1028 domain-containing protein [Pseudomaricurvus alkylphenolicus]|uniref:DUF1028 domain-containing protein n=1 Tax=Pseudomaricurvus alkylphenolicus TaxID=1306991 RepID=UPI001424A625|nr:DUF1028 domain-containing protein [Pseudomaricurvus alkylphenolicus]NIB41085.1 DUF1028 domain-containing protein [Pseudomaricurvus alkylphenolicus]
MTFSIAARCPDSGLLGIAVTSSSICVASRCGFARAGAGAALSQNITDPQLGTELLSLCSRGLEAPAALDQLCSQAKDIQWRQLALVDMQGNTAHFSGDQVLGIHGSASGPACVSVGNLLEHAEVPNAVIEGFQKATGHFASRLIAGLEAGLASGGEAGPIHSAGVMVVDKLSWPVVDLRVDWEEQADQAIGRLRSVWQEYEPQLQAYVVRALDPANSQSYGVPGDE